MSTPLIVIFSIAIILFTSKSLGLLMRRFGLPSVLGSILAGILIGPAIWSNFVPANELFPLKGEYISAFAEIGVILVLFSAGLETNLSDLKKCGLTATLVALGGVLVPLILGTGVGFIFVYPELSKVASQTNAVLGSIFMGVIMCATSVGITVETLKEMGKLNSKVGTIIVSAAIIDDVIGIVVLTIFMSFFDGVATASPILNLINPQNKAYISIIWMFVFFIFAICVGMVIHKLFAFLEDKHPITHRLPIYSLVVCFLYAFIAEVCFGVADITGAYIAGVILSTNHRCAEYVDKKVAVNSFMFFGPIFFANIGMQISFDTFDWTLLLFAVSFVVCAILAKIIGCGLTAKICHFENKDCLRIGVGMIARGEVALVIAQKGIDAGLMDGPHLAVVVMLVLVSSITAPIVLKMLYKDKREVTSDMVMLNNSIEDKTTR